jgi:gamma-glutamyltranspeptidase/glutathione hydrolase
VFTTRPELRGTFGMVASTHWLASATGMAVLERGGNAFDAAVAAGLTLQVVEPHMNGPGGEVPIVGWSAEREEVFVVCGQGVAPAEATVARFRDLGLDLIPGNGILAACVPGAFDGWMLLLRDFGTARLADVTDYAIGYAERGHPLVTAAADTIAAVEPVFRADWPTSAEIYLPASPPGHRFRNRPLAETYARIVREAERATRDRDGQIEAARDVYYRGFVAEAIARFAAAHGGLLSVEDLASWRATIEDPVAGDYHGFTVYKPGPWSQGPVFLQQLSLLAGFDLEAVGHNSADYVHTVVECAKLAFADREAWYGDPDFADVPLDELLSAEYARERRALVGADASGELRPGQPGARGPHLPPVAEPRGSFAAGLGDPTRGTCHVDVVDRHGNLVAATPSGGWLQSSPVVPELGFPLGTRAQMFWLAEGLPNSLEPGKRPRTTLSPSLVSRDGEPYLAFGTPGGDQQDQWSLGPFLAHVHFGLDLQAAIDAPAFHTNHLIGSFYPRPFEPRAVEVEGRLGRNVVDELRRRGHEVTVVDDWSLGRVSAAGREPDGLLKAAANARAMQGYAAGR